MGILDMLPWKKKENDLLQDVGANQQDPFASSSQSDSFQDPMQDPLASPQDPLANRDPLTSQSVLDGDTSRFDSMQDPFAELPSSSPSAPQSFAQQPQRTSRSAPHYQESYAQQPSYEQHSYAELPSRDVELILAKLDAIKAELDSVHQRVRKLEQVSDATHTQKYKW